MTTIPESKLCAICLMYPDSNDTITLQCTHKFCKDCLFQWKNGTCPLCRYSFSLKDTNLNEYKNSIHKWLNTITSKTLTSTYTLAKELLETKQKEYTDINTITSHQIMELTFYCFMDKLTNAFTHSIRSRVVFDTLTTSVEISDRSLRLLNEFNNDVYVILTQTLDEFEHELYTERTMFSDKERIKPSEIRHHELQKRLGYLTI